MKIHGYFLLNIKHGASQLYWGRPPNTTMRPPGRGCVGGEGGRGLSEARRRRGGDSLRNTGASNSLAPALSVTLHTCFPKPTTKFEWRLTHTISDKNVAQRRSGIVVSSEIKFMRIFAGVRWRGAFKWGWGCRNGDFRLFRSLYLPNLYIQGHNYYIVLCTPLVALQWQRNR